MAKVSKSFIKNSNLTIIKTPLFPKIYRTQSSKKFYVLLGIGGNIGDVKRGFEKLIFKLRRIKNIDILATSIILKNPPFGFINQPYFFNSVILIKVSSSPEKLLKTVLKIEDFFGRKREFKNSPRKMDIDIIFFNGRKIHKKELTIPHPFWKDRVSVTIPLKYLLSPRKSKEITKILQKLLTNSRLRDIIRPQTNGYLLKRVWGVAKW